MNPVILGQILSFGMQVFLKLPELIEAGRDIGDILETTGSMIVKMIAEKRPPNAEEWASMNALIATLREEFHAPGPDA